MNAKLERACSAFEHWVRTALLPFWATSGTDFVEGGFHERMKADATPLSEPRRVRVVSRQIYVFATALRHGWIADAEPLVEHGLSFLLGRMRQPSGLFAASVRPDGRPIDLQFNLYEHAFALFALAASHRALSGRSDLPAVAHEVLMRMEEGWGHADFGFHESNEKSVPVTTLLSNPHMHLFEAALEWERDGDPLLVNSAVAMSDAMARLCLTKLIRPSTGAVHEHFDSDWNIKVDATGDIVEPGHQFEWAWLLVRWGLSRGCKEALAAANKLAGIGESCGVDSRRGVALNQLDAELRVTDANAKLWPQTERIKAWCAIAGIASDEPGRAAAEERMTTAIEGLLRYRHGAPAGRWHELQLADGTFTAEPTRASSLYHIVCALDTIKQYRNSAETSPVTER